MAPSFNGARLAPPAAAKASARFAVALPRRRPWPASLVAASQYSTIDCGALGHPPERSGRIGVTLRAVTAKALKRTRSGADRRRRGFVSSGHLTSMLNRCFTGVRQTPADAAS